MLVKNIIAIRSVGLGGYGWQVIGIGLLLIFSGVMRADDSLEFLNNTLEVLDFLNKQVIILF